MNKAQFKELFDAHFDSIRSYAYYRTSDEALSSDIAQEVFMDIWDKRQRINLSNIKSLLYKITSDKVVSHYRKSAVRLHFAHQVTRDADIASSEDVYQYTELSQRYIDTLNQMPEKQRCVFLMHREEALKYHEIAERLGISNKAVEKRMNLALQLLKSKLIYMIIWILAISI